MMIGEVQFSSIILGKRPTMVYSPILKSLDMEKDTKSTNQQ